MIASDLRPAPKRAASTGNPPAPPHKFISFATLFRQGQFANAPHLSHCQAALCAVRNAGNVAGSILALLPLKPNCSNLPRHLTDVLSCCQRTRLDPPFSTRENLPVRPKSSQTELGHRALPAMRSADNPAPRIITNVHIAEHPVEGAAGQEFKDSWQLFFRSASPWRPLRVAASGGCLL